MNQRGRLLSLFFTVMSLAGVTFSLIWKAPLGLYIGLGFMILAVVVSLNILPRPPSIVEVAFVTSFMLATGALVAYAGFDDPLTAWFFLIAAIFSLPIVLFASRYLRSTLLKEQAESEAHEPHQGLWQRSGWLFINLGLTAALLAITGYLGWRTWPKVSGNVLILTAILLIFLVLGSMAFKRADKKLEHWLSGEGLLALSSLLYELFLPLVFVLLLLNFAMK